MGEALLRRRFLLWRETEGMLTLFSFMRLLLSFTGVLRSPFKTFGTSVATSPSLGKTLLSCSSVVKFRGNVVKFI